MTDAPKEQYLDKTTFFLMLGTAILLDCITWIPILGTVVNIVATLGFWFWFRIHGIKFNKNRVTTFAIGSIIEIIPFLQILPAWTATIIVMYFQSKLPPVVQSAISGDSKSIAKNLAKVPIPADKAVPNTTNVNKKAA